MVNKLFGFVHRSPKTTKNMSTTRHERLAMEIFRFLHLPRILQKRQKKLEYTTKE